MTMAEPPTRDTHALLDAAVAAMAKDVDNKPTRPRTMATRVVEEVYQAFHALALLQHLKVSELHRKILYTYLDQAQERRSIDDTDSSATMR